MDLNKLYSDHQILLIRASTAPDARSRLTLLSDAAAIARHVVRVHRAAGARAADGWDVRCRGQNRPLGACSHVPAYSVL